MAEGWIRLHRSIQSHWLWKDKPFSYGQAWMDLLMMVNHKEGKVLMDATLVTVPAGAVITSEKKLSDRWGWGRTKTRTFLKMLETDSMIVKKTTNKRTEINVVNWGKFQNPQTANVPQPYHSRTDAEQQPNTNNNNKRMNKNGKKPSAQKTQFQNFDQRTYDYTELEERLVNN